MTRKIQISTYLSYGFLGLLLFLTFYPIFVMIINSTKTNEQFVHQPFLPVLPLHMENFSLAWLVTGKYYLNSVIVALVSLVGMLFCASLSAYIIARWQFPGREIIFYTFLVLLMIPAVASLIPLFVLIAHLKMHNTLWGLILPYVAGGQAFAIFVLRTFFSELPSELFDAARIDGANHFQIYSRIVIPLSMPILSTLAILHVIGSWNDYVLPFMILQSDRIRTLPLGLVFFTNFKNPQPGVEMAGFVLASLPLFVIFLLSMRTFVAGLTSGAIKI